MAKKQKIGPMQDAWIRSLESGEHKQTKNVLCRKTDSKYYYCCLGLGCEVLIANNVPRVKCVIPNDDCANSEVQYNGAVATLTKYQAERLGLYDSDGSFGGLCGRDQKFLSRVDRGTRGNAYSLVDLNDTGWTFKSIAKLMRDYPQYIFQKVV